MFSNPRSFWLVLIAVSSVLISPTLNLATPQNQDIWIDVPAEVRLRAENLFGDVSAEVWPKSYVSISAAVEGTTSLKRSPIVVDNQGKTLIVSVVRSPIDASARINLVLKIPESTHLTVSTSSGAIELTGLSTSASLKTGTGNIRVRLSSQSDANISARSTTGAVLSDFGTTSDDNHSLQTRMGNGKQQLDAQTDSGAISVVKSGSSQQSVAEGVTEPRLVAPNGSARGAGTPESAAQSEEIGEGDVIRVDSQLVTLNMNVIDRGTNRGLAGLTQTDFRLYEDGQEQRILQFDSSAAPFDLVLLIDLSGSTRDVVKLIRQAAMRFIDAARPNDRISVITFAGEPKLVSSLTVDRDLLRQRVNAIDTMRGDTKLYDATGFAMEYVTKDLKKSRRTAIVLMSDGLDGTIPGVSGQRGSSLAYTELLKRLQEFDGVLYTLWLNTEYQALSPEDTQPEAFDAGHDRMKEMADAGGGLFYEVGSLNDLAGSYEQVVADLGTVYSLAYRPSNKTRDGKWRSIKITINRANAVARGKRGYYAN